MAVSFQPNSWQLANWGFLAGDIAALAGAGRGVITWLSASGRDRALLDFMKTSFSDVGMRRCLIERGRLNERWSTQIILFQNGRRCIFTPAGKSIEIENVDDFTWIMTTIVACLDVMVVNSVLHNIVLQLLIRVFEDNSLGVEYLEHEIPNHIQGWRSTACVRGMISNAQSIWRTLEEQGRHLPGFAPPSEGEEIIRMLHWLLTGKSARYSTSSSDAFSLAVLLADLGFDLLRTGNPDDIFSEANVAVIFDTSSVPATGNNASISQRRYGMRIPLQSPEECISLWPGPSASAKNNYRRQIFVNGMEIGADLRFDTEYDGDGLEWKYNVYSKSSGRLGRSDPDAYRLVHKYLLLETKQSLNGILELIQSWSLDSKEQGRVVRCLELGKVSEYDMEYQADLQVFLLGYYYGGLMPLMNFTQLSTQEALGSWTWYDLVFLNGIAGLVKSCRESYRDAYISSAKSITEPGEPGAGNIQIPRIDLIKLAAYLFAGAENDQMSGLGDLTHDAYGLNAKLVLLSASLIGLDRVGELELFDIDPTCIPSDHRGIIRAGRQTKCTTSLVTSANALHFRDELGDVQDFTAHLQPAWGFDPNRCLVTFRDNGRLVHKIHPGQLEYTSLVWRKGNRLQMTTNFYRPTQAYSKKSSNTNKKQRPKNPLLETTSQPLINALFDAMPKYIR